MTGYHIRIGYNSAMNSSEKAEAFDTLKQTVEELRTQTGRIVEEAKRERMDYGTDLLWDYALAYAPPAQDATLTISEPNEADEQPGEVMQLASGGGESRSIKELLRRAFCRLVIFEMHRKGIEVNLTVA